MAFKKFYVPTLMNKFVRPLVVLIFISWLCASIMVIPKIDVGLEVELTMTDDSYVLKYFKVCSYLYIIIVSYNYDDFVKKKIIIVLVSFSLTVYETLFFDGSSSLFCGHWWVKFDWSQGSESSMWWYSLWFLFSHQSNLQSF